MGDCCLSLIKRYHYETQIFSKLPYSIPDDDIVLWRYMDLAKFLSILQTKSLYFCRADKLDDPFEGAKCRIEDISRYEEWHKEELYKRIQNDASFNSRQKHGFVKFLLENEKLGLPFFRQNFINCWHESEYESIAMWNLFTTSLEFGVAIKTTYEKLCNSLENIDDIKIGKVIYHDLNIEKPNNEDDVLWYKLNPYKHEQEVRAIIEDLNPDLQENGKLIPVNLNLLIDEVYLSPSSGLWFKELVKDIMDKYGFNKKIIQSDLRNKPYK